jgi:hypothetical protein
MDRVVVELGPHFDGSLSELNVGESHARNIAARAANLLTGLFISPPVHSKR